MNPLTDVRAVCFDWGGTLMSEDGPESISMGLWPQVAVIPGAAECVAELAGKLPLAVATNASVSTRPLIERALSRVGLARYFADIFCYTELGFRKSQLEFWSTVTGRLGVRAEHVAMVGDSYEQDAVFPRKFGIQGVWFNPSYAPAGSYGPVPEVAHLSQFSAWVNNVA
jgi:FMN phosphatase YigB (HAD superfamily)